MPGSGRLSQRGMVMGFLLLKFFLPSLAHSQIRTVSQVSHKLSQEFHPSAQRKSWAERDPKRNNAHSLAPGQGK